MNKFTEKNIMKHTPGPWVACQDPDAYSSDDWCIGTGKNEIDEIAVCGAANARLIAAAPELLDVAKLALKAILDEAEARYFNPPANPVLVAELEAAIAKATGGAV